MRLLLSLIMLLSLPGCLPTPPRGENISPEPADVETIADDQPAIAAVPPGPGPTPAGHDPADAPRSDAFAPRCGPDNQACDSRPAGPGGGWARGLLRRWR